jgi:hypothetical protein
MSKQIFEGVLPAEISKGFFVPIAGVTDEFNLVINKTGLSVLQMCDGGTTLVIAQLGKSKFADFKLQGEELSIGINGTQLLKVIARIQKEDAVALSTDGYHFKVSLIGKSRTTDHNIRAIDVPIVKTFTLDNLPTINSTCTLEINGGLLKDILKDIAIGGGAGLRVKSENGVVHFISESETSTTEVALGRDVKFNGECNSLYSVEGIGGLVKHADSEAPVVIELGGCSPLKMNFVSGGNIAYIYAPMSEDAEKEANAKAKEAKSKKKEEAVPEPEIAAATA